MGKQFERPEQTMARALELRKEAGKQSKELRDQRSHDALRKVVKTKVQTAFVGPIAMFEEAFGFLWGHGMKDEDLTEEQRDARVTWNLIRTNIFNKGNCQLRALMNEFDRYTIQRKTFEYKLPVKGVESNGNH